jgi:hypothetical protein
MESRQRGPRHPQVFLCQQVNFCVPLTPYEQRQPVSRVKR